MDASGSAVPQRYNDQQSFDLDRGQNTLLLASKDDAVVLCVIF